MNNNKKFARWLRDVVIYNFKAAYGYLFLLEYIRIVEKYF